MIRNGGQVTYEMRNDVLVVRVGGEIDHHSAAMVRKSIDDRILAERPERVLLELSSVDFMDSSGRGLIMGRYTLLDSFGGETVLLNPTERIRKILDLAGFARICRVEVVKRKEGENHVKA